MEAEPRSDSAALRGEPEAILDVFSAIGIETYDCKVRPAIISPDRWRKVR